MSLSWSASRARACSLTASVSGSIFHTVGRMLLVTSASPFGPSASAAGQAYATLTDTQPGIGTRRFCGILASWTNTPSRVSHQMRPFAASTWERMFRSPAADDARGDWSDATRASHPASTMSEAATKERVVIPLLIHVLLSPKGFGAALETKPSLWTGCLREPG